jgi:hypothetical protein
VNILAARVAFRERPLVDVIDLSLRFVVVHAKDYAKVALAVLVPGVLASWAASSVFGWIFGWIVAITIASLLTVPFTLLASRLVFEEVPRTRDVLIAAARELPGILAVRVLTFLLLTLGLTVLVVPAFWFGAVLFFLDEVKLLERAPLTPAFARAQRLATSSLGGALMAHLLLLVLRVVAVALADVAGRAVIGELLQFRPPEAAFSAGGSVLALLGLFLTVPFFATARFFVYLDVRTRSEGWDVQTRFAALAARAAADARVMEAG